MKPAELRQLAARRKAAISAYRAIARFINLLDDEAHLPGFQDVDLSEARVEAKDKLLASMQQLELAWEALDNCYHGTLLEQLDRRPR